MKIKGHVQQLHFEPESARAVFVPVLTWHFFLAPKP
jgi:hypothetical protein